MKTDIHNKIVLITGSSKGIGLNFAEAFLKEGAIVVLNDILEEQLNSTVQRLQKAGYRAYGYCFDVSNETQVEKSVDKIEAEVGPIDILINNAGMQARFPLEEFPITAWRKIIDVNLTSAFIVGQCCAKKMIPRNYGKIINITSLNAEFARQNIAAYCSAKGGLKMLTKSMSTEWGKYGITVNAIGPGYFITDITAPLAADPQFDAWVKSEVPLGRWGKLEDLTGAALFLASQAADYITGQTIYIDGGWQASL